MKKLTGAIIMLLFLVLSTCSALGAGFDISPFEKDSDLYSIFQGESDIFIQANLTAKEKDFIHKNNSENYYNAIFPDIIVIDAGTEEEIVIPRLWIYYRTEGIAPSVRKAEFLINKTKYEFSVDNTQILALEKGTIEESFVIIIGIDSHQFLEDWCVSGLQNKPIEVKLIGSSDTIEFEIPSKVISTGKELYVQFALSGGMNSMYDYTETPVIVTAQNNPIPEGLNITYCDDTNKMSFTIPNGWTVTQNNDDGIEVSSEILWISEDRSTRSQILYYSKNLLAGIGEGELDISMEEIDNFFMTKENFAELMDIPREKIEAQKYGDFDYFTYSDLMVDNTTISGYSYSYPFTYYYNIDNGIIYLFMFAGDEQKIGDFEKLMMSVKHESSNNSQGEYKIKIN